MLSNSLEDNKTQMDIEVVIWGLKFAYKMNPLLFIGWVVLYLFSAVLPTVFIGLVSKTVDTMQENVAQGNGMKSIVAILVVLLVVMIINGLFEQLPQMLWTQLSNTYAIGMQKKMGEFMKTVPVRYFDDAETAKYMSMAQKKERTLGSFIASFFELFADLFALASMIVLAWNTSYLLLIVMAVFLAAVLPIGVHNARHQYQVWIDESQNENIADYYLDMVMKKNPKDVRLLQMEDYIMKKWRERRRPSIESYIKSNQKVENNWALMRLVVSITKFMLLFVGLFLLHGGQLTLGGLTLFVSVFSQMGTTSMSVGYDWMETYLSYSDLKFKKKMFELDFSDKRPLPKGGTAMPSRTTANEAPIEFEFRNVSFSYQKGRNVIHDLTLQIHKGEVIALVGENGAGKSTLVKLLLGLYEPDEGELFFEGTNYRDLNMTQMVNRIGVVFQDFVHFELMVRENVGFGDISKVYEDEMIWEAVKKGGAKQVVDKLPKGIDTYLGRWYEKEGGNMSGGEWQRIAVSRAHISDKDILVMDEPAAALDPIAEMEQFTQIKKSLHGRTSILISHRIGFARLADKIVVLSKGELKEFGTHEELMKRKGLYYDMFSNQASWYQTEVAK